MSSRAPAFSPTISTATIPKSLFHDGASLNAGNINYNTHKAAEALTPAGVGDNVVSNELTQCAGK
jgi:hypothetical protein